MFSTSQTSVAACCEPESRTSSSEACTQRSEGLHAPFHEYSTVGERRLVSRFGNHRCLFLVRMQISPSLAPSSAFALLCLGA